MGFMPMKVLYSKYVYSGGHLVRERRNVDPTKAGSVNSSALEEVC
jgi:hypothetical protein